MKLGYISIMFLGIILFVALLVSVHASIYNTFYGQAVSISAEAPKVILQNGTTGTSMIYANKTSAFINVQNSSTTYNYVLRVNNTAADSWQIRLEKYADFNISRLQNCSIYFRNSTNGISNQVYIENGSYTQDVGSWCDLTSLATVYIAVTAEASDTGTSYVYVYLEILVPHTTTHNVFIVVFEIT
jgi:hypothetical protein